MDIKKACCVAAVALILALAAYSLAQNAQTTADNNANITNVFEIMVNNTNLAPAEVGHPGTGERVTGVTYFANTSPIELIVFAHANTISQTATVEVNINGTVVANQSGRPLGNAEDTHRSITVIVPKYSSYVVNFSNYHHYEWREYPILSGRNGTLSINQSILGNSFNATYDQTTKEFNSNYTTQTFPNSTIITNSNNIAALQKNDSYFNGTVFPQSTDFRNDTINDTIIRNYTPHSKVGAFSRDATLASGTQSITGIGFKPDSIMFYALVGGKASQASWGFAQDGLNEVMLDFNLTTTGSYATGGSNAIYISMNSGDTINYKGAISSFDNDGFTISWTKTGATTGTITVLYKADR